MTPAEAHLHASCVARGGAGVLLLGASGSGKSDLALRLISRGFTLVADDRVLVCDGIARAPPTLAGLIEVRGLGIVRVAYLDQCQVALTVELASPRPPTPSREGRGLGDGGQPIERLPAPTRHPMLNLPLLRVAPFTASAPDVVALALDCAVGRATLLTGAFAA